MKLSLRQKIICWIAYAFVFAIHATYRYRFVNPEVKKQAQAQNPRNSVAHALWHENALSTALAHRWQRLAILVSQSFDGEIIAFIMRKFGVHSARGSSSRGGRVALRELIKLAEDGYEVGITVDGPRGPRHQVKPGLITLAARTGIPLLPTASRGRRTWIFHRSWDQFRFPKPFTEVIIRYGQPIFVPAEISDQALLEVQERLTQALQSLEAQLIQDIRQIEV